MNKERLKPWELREQQNKPKGCIAIVWHKLKIALIWIALAIAVAIDLILSLF
ncbi:hypothetical protein [Rhodohalobacter barkolensis]|uniref:hypothetical protein n=1 Tax=Rhodohalobacter barkolensis TaxID=2053187 RepID=UPI0013FE3A61|nr:hypothetical protein [Rhodohalobacter barkolensis]